MQFGVDFGKRGEAVKDVIAHCAFGIGGTAFNNGASNHLVVGIGPIDALCIWAGHASVLVTVTQAGQEGQRLQIGLPAPPEMKLPGEASYRGYRLSLQGLDPAPRAAVSVPLDQYRATVRVERAQ